MPEQNTDQRGVIILVSGILFIIAVIAVLFGVSKYTNMAKDKAVDLIKENAPTDRNTEQEESSADSTYLKNLKEVDQSGASGGSLDVAPTTVDYGFKLDMEKAAQQKESVQEYSVPSSAPGQPGSKEWQDKFWTDR